MARGARVQSIDAIRRFRGTLLKFAEAADAALADAEGETTRTLLWLETEQPAYWRRQLRQRTETLMRAKEALRMKTLFRDASGRPPPADQERKAVAAATRAVEEAENKLRIVKKWALQLQKEMSAFRGSAQRMATTLQVDVPRAAAVLDQAAGRLEAYVSLSTPPVAADGDADPSESMARLQADPGDDRTETSNPQET